MRRWREGQRVERARFKHNLATEVEYRRWIMSVVVVDWSD
jgi:hypothetical protein